jgi:hypothetical protein
MWGGGVSYTKTPTHTDARKKKRGRECNIKQKNAFKPV